MSALRGVFTRNNAKLRTKMFFQYVILASFNDLFPGANDLFCIRAGVSFKINLIHFNRNGGSIFQQSDDETIATFWAFLVEKVMLLPVGKSRSNEQMTDCGQLGRIGDVIAPTLRVPENNAHVVVVKATENDKYTRQRQKFGSDITV